MLCLLQGLFAVGSLTYYMFTHATEHVAQTLARQLFIIDD
jgi:hypothetical protein